jgi:hypothetical protein
MRLGTLIISILLLVASASSCSKSSSGGGGVLTPQAPEDKNWKFESTPTWSDEFSTAGLPDASKWGYDIGGHGWGNKEVQHYTNDIKNAMVVSGQVFWRGV